MDLAVLSLLESPDLTQFIPQVPDSGEGHWTLIAVIDESVPAPILSAVLCTRCSSRGAGDFAAKVLSALRYQFGGYEDEGRR